jgi:hypothetical protein
MKTIGTNKERLQSIDDSAGAQTRETPYLNRTILTATLFAAGDRYVVIKRIHPAEGNEC